MWLLVALLAGLCFAARPLPASPPPSLPEMLEDAELRDIHFVDSGRGWAVGDRGVIWHTEDGGASWRLQDSPVSCRLDAIDFVDAEHGWIVGGWVHPYTHRSTGVVLHTSDGGRRWVVYSQLTLPALKQVRFVDPRQGWAVGHRSAMHRSGVFRTEDGGRSWAAVPGGDSEGWLAADFRDARSGAVAGRTGKLGLVALNQLKPSQTPDLGLRHLRDLRLSGAVEGWLVGDGGLVMRTGDGGFTWQAPPGRLPPGVAEQFDFRTVSVRGPHCWIAGSPGTRILHSADGGRQWSVQTTGQLAPLNSVFFLDEYRGWACGSLGTILVTSDGGRHWHRQRTGGTRAALLGMFSEPRQVPFELLAQVAGEEGYLAHVEILNRRDLELPEAADAPLDERIQRAVVSAGGSSAHTAWRFPLRQAGLGWSARSIIAGWDFFSDGQGTTALEAHLVRQIRLWRPEVVVTESASLQDLRPLAHLTNQFVLSAVQKAADPTAYSDQITLAGLQPWSVKKVFSHEVEDRSATITLHSAQLATRLGQSLGDQAAYAQGLIDGEYTPPAASHGLRLLINRLPHSVGQRDIFHGIGLPAGGEARRARSTASATNLAELTRRVQKARNVHQLLDQNDAAVPDAMWLSQLDDLTGGLDDAVGGRLLFQLAQRYRRQGQAAWAAEALEHLLQRYPEHSLAEHALAWLIQFHASGEAGWRTRAPHQLQRAQLAARPIAAAPIQQAAYEATPRETTGPLAAAVAGHGSPINPGQQVRDRAAKAVQWGKLIESRRPSLHAEPQVRLPLAAAYRALGMPREADRFHQGLASQPASTAWVRCAQAELWLKQAHGPPPKPIGHCVPTSEPPYLDGQLEDPAWSLDKPLRLETAEQNSDAPPASVHLAYDDQFLYVAARCAKSPEVAYPSDNAPRPRDGDLSRHDRIDLLLDVDRDFTTFYRLSFDHRGWTGEACLGDTSWNPQWFVAAAESEKEWTVEAAIAWSELVPHPPRSRHAWAIGVQRILPGQQIQSFSRPAAVQPRGEGFGLLIFQ